MPHPHHGSKWSASFGVCDLMHHHHGLKLDPLVSWIFGGTTSHIPPWWHAAFPYCHFHVKILYNVLERSNISHLCLVHIWPAMGLRSLYPPFRAASVRPPCGGRGWLWDFCTDCSVASTILFSGKLYKFENRKSVAHRHVVGGIAQSPHGHRAEAARSNTARWCHGHRTISAQPLHGSRTGSARLPSRGCGDCTISIQSLHAASVRIYPGLAPRARTRNRTMLIDNVNTYAVARSHLRCPKKRTENCRQMWTKHQ